MSSVTENARLPIVSCDWLQKHLYEDGIRVLDASWHLPAANRDAMSEFNSRRIPGAVFFDIDKHSAPGTLPHMLPDAGQFAEAMGSLGIAAHHEIIVYDSVGLFSAARVWWMFKHFGAGQVFVLDGGLPAWQRSGGKLASSSDRSDGAADSIIRHEPCEFIVNSSLLQRQRDVVNAEQVLAAIDDEAVVILDARAAGRFTGDVKEARPGLRSGHIPGSLCLPFTQVLDDQGLLKSVPELVALFDTLPLGSPVRILTTCGSGVTAAVLCLALECAGYANVALYDGSWSEWGALDNVPVATGP